MIERLLKPKLIEGLANNPAVAILGPRQVGKTTLALEIAKNQDSIYLDLESPRDMAKLQDPIAYLSMQEGKLVVLDEIQRQPELFQVLRGIIDKGRQAGNGNGQFLILGSASIDLLKQSSESLAGRIRYLELGGLSSLEVDNINHLWVRGGFPTSYLGKSNLLSAQWREDFIRIYLERDVPQLGPRVPATTLRRLWTMLAHLQGSTINLSRLASGLDISNVTVGRYVDLLCDLLLLRKIEPYFSNTKKRLVKAPKVYVRDSGLLHQLLNITDLENLLSCPVVGASWEGFVIENILSVVPSLAKASFYRNSSGDEIDLILELPGRELWAIEIKRSSSPKLEKGFYNACEDVKPTQRFVVYNGDEDFPLPNDVMATGLPALMRKVQSI